jgi:Phosphoesterase family
VILMQENRSFDHYFGSLRGVGGFADSLPIPWPNALGARAHHTGPPWGASAAAFGLWVPFVGLAGLVCVSIIPSYTLIEETAPGRRGRTGDAEAALTHQGWKPLLAYLCTV